MKDHTYIPVPENGKVVFDYRSVIENRIKEVPDVPMFSFADNETGEAIAAWLRPQRLLAR